jgi:hypothetical protein
VTATKTLRHDDVRRLRAAASRFGGAECARKSALLAQGARRAIVDADVLVAWHDCLLYLIAYPESAALLRAARAELRRVAALARQLTATGPARERRRLEGSGLAWTTLTFAFGWDVARWLAARFPRHSDVDSFGDGGAPLPEVLGAALPPLEFGLLASAGSGIALLDEMRRRGSRLACLVAQFERLPCPDAVRALLFDSLETYLVLHPRASALSRTFVRGLPAPVFFHRDGLVRSIDLPALLGQRLPPARVLGVDARRQAIDAACAMLAALGRETDAIALAYPGGVEWHDVGRGIAVALYTMRPDRRDALDSHVGMMLFKNGLPVGYGGGWPFAGTCRVGINIFEPYRGGESALLFGQVLRVYCQRFGIRRFVVEPSQFGGANTEGLRSGAFWFYYRLGFRPVDARAAARARDEHTQMQADPAYRTPLRALRRITDSDLELALGLANDPSCEPAQLSAAVTAWIDGRFGGDRSAAEIASTRAVVRALAIADLDAWPPAERRALATLAPLLAQISELARWPVADRRRLVAIIRAKGGDEFRFHRRLLRHGRLRRALSSLSMHYA